MLHHVPKPRNASHVLHTHYKLNNVSLVDRAHNDPRALPAGDASGSVVRLAEKPLEERLEALYKSRAYALAVAVAEVERVDPSVLAGIRRCYADFLYAKRDYAQALEQ